MKVLKWILGIVLAGIITLGLAAFAMHHNGNVDMTQLTAFQYWVVYLTIPSLAFGGFVFLSIAFVPSYKKKAGVLVIALSLLFVGYGCYQHYIDNGYLPGQYIVRYSGFVAGLTLGFLMGYKVFKSHNW